MKKRNRILDEKYNISVNEMKKVYCKSFWNKTYKRKILYNLNKIKLFRGIIKRISPFELPVSFDFNQNYISNSKIAVYTCIFGNYDFIPEPEVCPDNIDYYIVTDMNISPISKWVKVDLSFVDETFNKMTDIEKNRYVKMHPHKFFKDYQYSIYIDGNIKILTDFTEYIQEFNEIGLKLHKHYRTKCVYKEIENCRNLGKDTSVLLDNHRLHLMNENMPRNFGMLEAPIIVRDHHNKKCIEVMEFWWSEFLLYSNRDQISLPYVLFKLGIKIEDVGVLGNDIYSNFSFEKYEHNSI